MSKLSEEELLNVVKQVFMGWLEVDEKFELAIEQIVALIKNVAYCSSCGLIWDNTKNACECGYEPNYKPEITEEWIEEKAQEIYEKISKLNPSLPTYSFLNIAKDFIRKIVREGK